MLLNSTSTAKRVIVNTGFLYFRMAITFFVSLYTLRILLAELGTDDFGLFNVIVGTIAMFDFLNATMTAATQRFMSFAKGEGDTEKQNQIFNVSLFLHFGISILAIIVLEVAYLFLFNGILNIPEDRLSIAKTIYHFMVFSSFITINMVPFDAVVNANENMLFIAVLGVIESIAKFIFAIYLTITSFDKLLIYSFLLGLFPIILLIIKINYTSKNYSEVKLNIQKKYDKTLYTDMVSFAGWSFLSSASSIVTMQGITIVLNSFFGVLVNAAQGVANQITGQLMSLSATMLKALNPVIVKSEGENNRSLMLKASITGNKLSFFIISFFAIPMIIETPIILKYWLKNVPEYSVIFTRLVLIRMMLSQLTTTFRTAIGATGNIKVYTIIFSAIFLTILPISVVFFYFELPPYIIYLNLIVLVILLNAIDIYYTHKLCGLNTKEFLIDVVVKCLGIGVLIYLVAVIPTLFFEPSLKRITFVFFINVTMFLLLLLLLGLTKSEKSLINNLMRTLINKTKLVGRNK